MEIPVGKAKLLIYDQFGRVVHRRDIDDRIENYAVRLEELSAGMYYLEVVGADNRRWNKPFIKME